MLKKIKLVLASFAALSTLLAPVAFSGVAGAVINQADDINKGLCSGATGDLGGTGKCDDSQKPAKLNTLVKTIINIISIIVGVVAVIMIIIGGFRYVTSGGKEASVGSAKNTILYALVGLVVVALAQLVVHFILNNLNTATK